MKILLHVCCAPCAIYPVEAIRREGHQLEGYFYNPNIHPYSEYLKRRDEIERYAVTTSLKVSFGAYDLQTYFEHVVLNDNQKNRCPVCWWVRALKTAKFAKENGFDAFTTTLLGSPYQDHAIVKRIYDEVASQVGIVSYYHDFRAGFKAAHVKARSLGIYCQNYCGCLFSEVERIENKRLAR